MKQLTLDWIDKAEGDWFAAQQLYRARKHPNYDAACFHTQQCAEKYLKARPEEAGIVFSKTHNLSHLLTLALQVEPQWIVLQPQMNALGIYAVDFRYPGKSASKPDACLAIKDCRVVRRIIRTTLGLPV
ncbi:MAG TPA: HEPN domain-containing protein [Blastocatellia bacterium]|nr:HEPN domain-containing protein [Blastocatellia bacterium]